MIYNCFLFVFLSHKIVHAYFNSQHGHDYSYTHTHKKYISSLYMFIYRIKNPWSSGRSIQSFVCVLSRRWYILHFGTVDPAKDTWKTNKKKDSRENDQNVSLSTHDDIHLVLRRRKGLEFSKFNLLKKKFNYPPILLSYTSRNNLQKASGLFKRDTPLATNDLNLDKIKRKIHL